MTATDLPTAVGTAEALLRGTRPRQWVKNVLVLAAPLAAGTLFRPDVLLPTLLALFSFVLASSAVYLMNDSVDVEADRRHPRKRLRPRASGELSARTSWTAAGVLGAGSLLVATAAGVALVVLISGYLVLQVAYAMSLKHQPVLDLGCVAAGFLLRAVAGGVAADLPISQWFLLVAGFGSLFVVAGKRYSELTTLGGESGTRRALVSYTDSYLRFVWGIATGITVMSYSLWAFDEPESGAVPWHALSIAPFVLGLLRYAVDIDAGKAGEPEEIIAHDHVLQAIGGVWLICVGIAVISS